jgi:hydroxyacid-oxoacid transhydrogenase
LSHALESYTARPYTARAAPSSPGARPMSQGRNPWSDAGAMEALRLTGESLVAAATDASATSARESLSWAATLAGIAFGNAGVHLPHAMSYSVAGLGHAYRCPGYPNDESLVPHGISVIVNAPSVFRVTAPTSPDRHLAAARALGADARGAGDADAGAVLADALVALMKKTKMPNGVSGVGYHAVDLDALTRGAIMQKRLVENAPMAVDEVAMKALFCDALAYW